MKFLPTSPFRFLSHNSNNRKRRGASVVVNSSYSSWSSHVSRRTKTATSGDQARTKIVTSGDQARHIKCHIQPRGERETLGLTTTSYLAPRRDFGSRQFTLNPEERTSYLLVVISPHSNASLISIGTVMDSSRYLSMLISTIKHGNPSSHRRIQTKKSCRYEDPKICAIGYVSSGYSYT